jgi:hypothetical protein
MWGFANLFERLRQGVLPRIGVEPPEQLGSGRFLQLDGGNEAEHLVPLRFNEGLFDIPIGEELVALLFVFTSFAKPIQLLVCERLNPWGKGKPQEMERTKDNFAIAVGIRGVNVAFDDVVVHEAIDDIGGFASGRTHHLMMP